VSHDERASAGAAYDLGLHVVRCPKYRRPVLEGRVAVRLRELFKGYTSRVLREEFRHLRSRLPALWSRWCFAAAVGAVSAEAVPRYTGTRYERSWRKEKTG
jgi:putative transposase